MSEPERTPHPAEPAEGAEDPGSGEGTGRTPHPEQPAEGPDSGSAAGADTPAP